MNDLLGVDVTQGKFLLAVFGSTVKLDEDFAPVPGSSGVFLYDALSDEEGAIWIDGQNATEEFLNRDRWHFFEQVIDGQGQVLTTQQISLMSGSAWDVDLVDYQLLSASDWRADLRMFYREFYNPESDLVVPGKIVAEINGVRRSRSGTFFGCRWVWYSGSNGFLDGLIRRYCNVADLLRAEIHVTRLHSGVWGGEFIAEKEDAHAVSASFWWAASNPEVQRHGCADGLAIFRWSPFTYDNEFVYTPDANPNNCP